MCIRDRLKGLQCLKKCGMSIKDMKLYMNYCMEGPSTIPERKEMPVSYTHLTNSDFLRIAK